MEQNTEQSEKYKVPIISMDTLFNIEVSGYFLRRCQILLMTYGESIGNDEFIKILEKMKTNQASNTQQEETIFILVGLVDAMEKTAKKEGKAEEKELSSEEFYKMIIPVPPKQS
jgi:hypothetical protein